MHHACVVFVGCQALWESREVKENMVSSDDDKHLRFFEGEARKLSQS